MVALVLVCTSSDEIPIFSMSSAVIILPPNTPMEPVIVPGWATILSAAAATK